VVVDREIVNLDVGAAAPDGNPFERLGCAEVLSGEDKGAAGTVEVDDLEGRKVSREAEVARDVVEDFAAVPHKDALDVTDAP
jgi:hypothetical protein